MKKVLSVIVVIIFFTLQLSAQSWNYVSSTGTSFILFGMSFPPSQSTIGYACGMQYTYDADGVIVKTTDGGNNWTAILPTSGAIDGLQGIWFISETLGFAGGWNNYFIKTTDGGNTWVPTTCGSNVWYYVDVEFWDSSNGVAAGSMNSSSDQSVFITSDGGNTWVSATSGTNVNIMGICYADQNTLFAVGTSGNVIKSTDGGHNWNVSATLPAMLFGLDFADASFGVVGGEEKMFATNDGGTTWSTYTTGYENFYAALAYDNGTAYVGGTDENIYVTTDFGANWSFEHNGPGQSHLYRIREVESSALFACGSQGTIITREAQFNANFSSDVDSVCAGNAVNFTDLSVGAITSWNWIFEGGTPSTSTDENPTIIYNSIGIYDVSLEVSDGTNISTEIIQDMITVLEDPSAPDQPAGDSILCAGVTVDYTTQPVSGADTYFWEVDPSSAGNISGTGTTGTFESDNSFTGTYTIKVKANNMCGYGPWSQELNCTLNMTPQAFELSEGGGYCSGDPGIEITLDGSEIAVTYELFLDGSTTGIIVDGTGNPISFGIQSSQGIYTVTGTTGICAENMVGTPYIFVEFIPEAGYTPEGPDTVCSGSMTDYTTQPIFAADTIYWNLYPADAGTILGSGENISIDWNPTFAGLASLTTNGSNNCGIGNESIPLEITILSQPEPEVNGPSMVCDEDEAEYTTYENLGSSYDWTVTGGEITSGNGTHMITVLWGSHGLGMVQVSENIGQECLVTSGEFQVTIDDCTNIDELIATNLTIYPNPVKDALKLSFTIAKMESYSIKIQTLLGRNIKTINGIGKGSIETYIIKTNNMINGRYIVNITTESGANIHEHFVLVK